MTQLEIWKQTYENKLSEYLENGYSERKAKAMAKKVARPLHPNHKRAQKRNMELEQAREAGSITANKLVVCPACGELAEKRSAWEMKDGSRNRLYIHATKLSSLGFEVVTKSCVVNEPPKNKV